jgi:hypothetical protein
MAIWCAMKMTGRTRWRISRRCSTQPIVLTGKLHSICLSTMGLSRIVSSLRISIIVPVGEAVTVLPNIHWPYLVTEGTFVRLRQSKESLFPRLLPLRWLLTCTLPVFLLEHQRLLPQQRICVTETWKRITESSVIPKCPLSPRNPPKSRQEFILSPLKDRASGRFRVF